MRACQKLGRHVLMIETHIDVYVELLQLLLDVVDDQINVVEEENHDPNALV